MGIQAVMIAFERRAVLRFCACFVSLIALSPSAAGLPDDDELIIVRGWMLKKSDLRTLGW